LTHTLPEEQSSSSWQAAPVGTLVTSHLPWSQTRPFKQSPSAEQLSPMPCVALLGAGAQML
jgi:hypothetical protein